MPLPWNFPGCSPTRPFLWDARLCLGSLSLLVRSLCRLLRPLPSPRLSRHVVLFLTRVYEQDLEKPVCRRGSRTSWLPPPPRRVSGRGSPWRGRGPAQQVWVKGSWPWDQHSPAVLGQLEDWKEARLAPAGPGCSHGEGRCCGAGMEAQELSGLF